MQGQIIMTRLLNEMRSGRNGSLTKELCEFLEDARQRWVLFRPM